MNSRVYKTRRFGDGFLKPVDMRTGFLKTHRFEDGVFKPVNARTGGKIQHHEIQVKFTCGVLKKKKRGFFDGLVDGFKKTHRLTPRVFS